MRRLCVLDPGMFTTVQDLGRPGHSAIGVPLSGAADRLSLVMGNRLLGNTDVAAALECTLAGPNLTLEGDAWVCLTGAPCPDSCITGTNGDLPLSWCEPVRVSSGESIAIGTTGRGARAYLCVSGGLGVAAVLDSRSTLVGAAIGGHEGRPLRQGDGLPLIEALREPRAVPSDLHRWLRSQLDRRVIRVVRSLHSDRFPPCALEALTSAAFTVRPQSDRIGTRLDGPAVRRPDDVGSCESEPTLTGAIQITGDGRPIVLGPDRPTTGGYPLLACVVEADLPAMASLRPHDSIRFELISGEDARAIASEQQRTADGLLPPCEDGAGA
ncbi:MAG: biotin-dependent carboxyltransferase family protein [Planctomycetota bacterium]